MKIDPLLVITQPRDIPQWTDAFYNNNLGGKYDRLVIKYERPSVAWHKARELFLSLSHPEYTHYIYGTDDLLFQSEDLDCLIADYERMCNPDTEVLAADMNLDMEVSHVRGWQLDKYKLPLLVWNRSLELQDYHFADAHNPETETIRAMEDGGFIKCSWSALALAIIPRHIIERTSFDNSIQFTNPNRPNTKGLADTLLDQGCANDVVFAAECKQQGFSLWTDLNIQATHLKPSVSRNLWYKELCYVGLRQPEYFILKADTNEKININ